MQARADFTHSHAVVIGIDADTTTLTRTATLRVTNVADTTTCSVDVNIEPCQ